MTDPQMDCLLCRGPAGDAELGRIQVWDDAHWRLTISLVAEVPGFSYLELIGNMINSSSLHGFLSPIKEVNHVQ